EGMALALRPRDHTPGARALAEDRRHRALALRAVVAAPGGGPLGAQRKLELLRILRRLGAELRRDRDRLGDREPGTATDDERNGGCEGPNTNAAHRHHTSPRRRQGVYVH